jgi:hypothetical protein
LTGFVNSPNTSTSRLAWWKVCGAYSTVMSSCGFTSRGDLEPPPLRYSDAEWSGKQGDMPTTKCAGPRFLNGQRPDEAKSISKTGSVRFWFPSETVDLLTEKNKLD